MKLSELVFHTSAVLGIPHSTVESHARYLREAGLLSSGARGVAAAEMSDDEKLSLLIAVCGCSTARSAPSQLPDWLNLPVRWFSPSAPLSFLTKPILKESLHTLFDEINSGAVRSWCGEDHDPFVTARFEIDRNSASITLEKIKTDEQSQVTHREANSIFFSDAVDIDLDRVFRGEERIPIRRNASPGSLSGHSKLIREVGLAGLSKWGACLGN